MSGRWELWAKGEREAYFLEELEKKDIVKNNSITFRLFGFGISSREWKLTWIGENIRKMHDDWSSHNKSSKKDAARSASS